MALRRSLLAAAEPSAADARASVSTATSAEIHRFVFLMSHTPSLRQGRKKRACREWSPRTPSAPQGDDGLVAVEGAVEPPADREELEVGDLGARAAFFDLPKGRPGQLGRKGAELDDPA